MSLDSSNPETLLRLGLKSLGHFLCARDLSCKFLETAIFVPDEPDPSGIEGVCYVAVEASKKGAGDTAVTAMMVELRSNGSASSLITATVHHEAECPEHVDCPLEVLAVLTPTDCKRAVEWRRKCLKGTFSDVLERFSFGQPPQPA